MDPSPLASACLCTRRTQARYLKFCQDYNPRACCIPGHDLENQVQFENLISALGPGCKNPMMYPEVRFFYCLGCDPDQPKYTIGDTIRVCKSFLDRMWRDPACDECGVMYSNPCPAAWGDDADFDPYMCGDSLLLPRQTYNDNPTAFINVFKPPGLDDFNFVSIDGEPRARTTGSAPATRTPRTHQRAHAHARLWLWAHNRLPALPLSLSHTHSLTHSPSLSFPARLPRRHDRQRPEGRSYRVLGRQRVPLRLKQPGAAAERELGADRGDRGAGARAAVAAAMRACRAVRETRAATPPPRGGGGPRAPSLTCVR